MRCILIVLAVQVASAVRPAGALAAGLAYLGSYGGVRPVGHYDYDYDYEYEYDYDYDYVTTLVGSRLGFARG